MAHAQCQAGQGISCLGPAKPLGILLWPVSRFSSQSGPAMRSSPSKRQFARWDAQMMTRGSSSNPMIPSNRASLALAPRLSGTHGTCQP